MCIYRHIYIYVYTNTYLYICIFSLKDYRTPQFAAASHGTLLDSRSFASRLLNRSTSELEAAEALERRPREGSGLRALESTIYRGFSGFIGFISWFFGLYSRAEGFKGSGKVRLKRFRVWGVLANSKPRQPSLEIKV